MSLEELFVTALALLVHFCACIYDAGLKHATQKYVCAFVYYGKESIMYFTIGRPACWHHKTLFHLISLCVGTYHSIMERLHSMLKRVHSWLNIACYILVHIQVEQVHTLQLPLSVFVRGNTLQKCTNSFVCR